MLRLFCITRKGVSAKIDSTYPAPTFIEAGNGSWRFKTREQIRPRWPDALALCGGDTA